MLQRVIPCRLQLLEKVINVSLRSLELFVEVFIVNYDTLFIVFD